MGRRSENQRGHVVSCRLNEEEMEELQEMALVAECSISDLLRKGLRSLTQSSLTDFMLGIQDGNTEGRKNNVIAA